MKKSFFLIIFFLILSTNSYSDINKKIIEKLESFDNFTFDFSQKINNDIETGFCIIKFNAKINCVYKDTKKIIVSNGEILIVKSRVSNIPNFYKLEETPFYNLLNKRFLIEELESGNLQKIEDKYYLEVFKDNIEINIYFDQKNFYLKGWETTDIYNNVVSTNIYIKEVNKIVSDDLFDIKKYN